MDGELPGQRCTTTPPGQQFAAKARQPGHCNFPQRREALDKKLQDIDRRIAGLIALRAELARRIETPAAGRPLRSGLPVN